MTQSWRYIILMTSLASNLALLVGKKDVYVQLFSGYVSYGSIYLKTISHKIQEKTLCCLTIAR